MLKKSRKEAVSTHVMSLVIDLAAPETHERLVYLSTLPEESSDPTTDAKAVQEVVESFKALPGTLHVLFSGIDRDGLGVFADDFGNDLLACLRAHLSALQLAVRVTGLPLPSEKQCHVFLRPESLSVLDKIVAAGLETIAEQLTQLLDQALRDSALSSS